MDAADREHATNRAREHERASFALLLIPLILGGAMYLTKDRDRY